MLGFAAATVCRADEGVLDWSAWRAMPVMDAGRRMPLDTFARETVKAVCGKESPWLEIDGQARKYSSAELLFSWLAEPEKWDGVAFLRAGNETLRKEILDLPPRDALGKRLRYVSPGCLEKSEKFDRSLNALAVEQEKAADEGRKFSLSGEDEAAAELNKAYGVYRTLSFDPRRPAIARTRFFACLGEVVQTWRRDLAPNLRPWLELKQEDKLGGIVGRVDASVTSLISLYHKDSFPLSDAEPSADALCKASDELNLYFHDTRDRAFEASDKDAKMLEPARAMVNTLAMRTNVLARQSSELRRSLFDNGRSLRVVPALDPWGLELERDPMLMNHPWLNLQAVVFGSDQTLAGYPVEKVAAVRDSFEEVRAVYVDRDAAERPRRFASAMRRFADSMRELGEAIEPSRAELPIVKRDEALIAATAYPPPGFTSREVLYNRLDPFLWSWAVTLASVVCFALGFGVLRLPMFLLGMGVLAVGQGFTLYGLWLRAKITGMIPVTNMFETVLFVGATVALLGLWFGMLPLLWPGLGKAWELTAVAWRKTRVGDADDSPTVPAWSAARVCMLLVRGLFVGAMVYLLAIGDFNPSGDGAVLGLLPKSASAGWAGLSGTVVLWAISLPVFLWIIWFFPRAIPAAALSVVLVPWTLVKQGFKGPLDESLDRRAFVVSGAAVALIAYLVAYFAPGPVFNRGVGLEMAAVLRNNFWLAIHVLIITASYGAGALAWGLGNVSMAFYAFGRYSDADTDGGKDKTARRRPPQECVELAEFTYRAIQLAVLLLAAGTITGAIWADFAWGRYWGWDPKEVWALVTLLIYMVILHGRWAGWAGDFGMALGAVLGATSIMMAWYGVNFILVGGLHSYGIGSGGQMPVVILVTCNWAFVAFAAVRYQVERRG